MIFHENDPILVLGALEELYIFFLRDPKIRHAAHLRGRYLRAQKELRDVRGL